MKEFRIILCTLFFVLCPFVTSRAVDLPRQGVGLQIGWAQPTLRTNDRNSADTLNHHTQLHGVKVGFVYDASYAAGFGSSMGINYTFGVHNDGWQSTNPVYGIYPRSRTLITYNELELFVDWQYKFEVAKETYLILYTGPTIQCGIELDWRKDTQTEDIITGEITTTRGDRINSYTTNDENSFKRLNVTWGVGAGFQYKRYFLRGGYDFGLINPFKLNDYSTGIHTRGRFDQWSIKVGIYIWYAD